MSGELVASFVLKFNDQGSAAAERAIKAIERAMKSIGETSKTTSSVAISAFQKLANARETLGIRSEKVIQNEIRQTEAAYKRLADSGTLSMREQARAADAARNAVIKLQNEMGVLTSRQKALRAVDMVPSIIAGGYVAERLISKPLNKFAELEQAQTDLRISMTNKSGKVSPQYKAVLGVAQELGNKLPGSTRDFVLEAQALKQQGIEDSVISGGGLRSAGLLRVGMGLSGQGEAAMLVAKSMHTFGLKDNELEGAADHTFRLHKAFGQNAGAITEANTYMGGTLNQLGWTGFENMKKVQAMQGMMAMKGLESSVFGTNFADMLSFIARNETRLKGNSAATKEVNEILGSHGIKLDLFDKQGKFASPDQFIKEMMKLQVLTQKEQVEVFHKLFGTQGERVATALVNGGTKGVAEAESKIDNIVPLTEAVKQQTDTFSGKSDALAGSVENMLAEMGRPIGDALKPILDALNNLTGKATEFFANNPLAGAATAIGGAAAAWLAVSGLFRTLLGGVGVPVRVVNGLPGLSPDGLPGAPPSGPSGATKARDIARKAPLLWGAAGYLGLAYGANELANSGMNWGFEKITGNKGHLGESSFDLLQQYQQQQQQPLVIENNIHIDGEPVARVVNKINSRDARRH